MLFLVHGALLACARATCLLALGQTAALTVCERSTGGTAAFGSTASTAHICSVGRASYFSKHLWLNTFGPRRSRSTRIQRCPNTTRLKTNCKNLIFLRHRGNKANSR